MPLLLAFPGDAEPDRTPVRAGDDEPEGACVVPERCRGQVPGQGRVDRAEPGRLAGPLAQPEQRDQRDRQVDMGGESVTVPARPAAAASAVPAGPAVPIRPAVPAWPVIAVTGEVLAGWPAVIVRAGIVRAAVVRAVAGVRACCAGRVAASRAIRPVVAVAVRVVEGAAGAAGGCGDAEAVAGVRAVEEVQVGGGTELVPRAGDADAAVRAGAGLDPGTRLEGLIRRQPIPGQPGRAGRLPPEPYP